MSNTNKNHFIIQWLGGDRYYVKKTYCGRVILSSSKIDAKMFNANAAEKYIQKLRTIDQYNEFQIREKATI